MLSFVQATISTDSYVRIYTCLSPTLSDWQLTTTVSLPSLQYSPVAKSNTNAGSTAGNDDVSQSHQASTSGGASGLTLTNALGQSSSSTSGTSSNSANAPNPGKGNEALGGWCLSWCKERWWGQVMAATSGHSGIIKVSPVPRRLASYLC
jgi:nucleoporin SEH1